MPSFLCSHTIRGSPFSFPFVSERYLLLLITFPLFDELQYLQVQNVFKHYEFVELKASQQQFVLFSAHFSPPLLCVSLSSIPLSSEVTAFITGTTSALP